MSERKRTDRDWSRVERPAGARAMIAALNELGHGIDSILLDLCRKHAPTVMPERTAAARSRTMQNLTTEDFGHATLKDVMTAFGIVRASWLTSACTRSASL